MPNDSLYFLPLSQTLQSTNFVQMAPFLGIIVTLCGLTGQWHPLSLSRHIWSIYWETIWDHDVSCDDSLIIFIKKARPIKPKELSVVIYFRGFCCPLQYLRRYICDLWTGTFSLTTVREVSVKVGTRVSIQCLYEPSLENHVKYLCKGYNWCFCSKKITTNSKSSSPEGLYTISDDPDQGVFTVSIISQEEGTQIYWCAVEIPGALDEKTYFYLLVSRGECVLF